MLIASAVAVTMLAPDAPALLVEHGISPRQVTFNNGVAFPNVAQTLKSNEVSALRVSG